MTGNFDRKLRLPRIHFRVLLHAANMRHGTNGFISLPKEGMLRILSPWKIQRLRAGLNPRTWLQKVSTLPLDSRSSIDSVTITRYWENKTDNQLIKSHCGQVRITIVAMKMQKLFPSSYCWPACRCEEYKTVTFHHGKARVDSLSTVPSYKFSYCC